MNFVVFLICCCFATAKYVHSASDIEQKSSCQDLETEINYPAARRDESVVDNLHGTKITDPYRWLENPNSSETKQFIEAENELSQSFLAECDVWPKINEKLKTMWNYRKFSVPERYGKYYFSFMNTGLQNQDVLYKQSALSDEPTVLLDLNELSPDGAMILGSYEFSIDGSLLGYGVFKFDSDWIELRIRNVESGQDYPETLTLIDSESISWTHDNKGFFYASYPMVENTNDTDKTASNNQKLFYHRLGENQDKDILVAEFLEYPDWEIYTDVSDCGKYLIIYLSTDDLENQLYYVDLEQNGEIKGKMSVQPIVTEINGGFAFVANTGSKFVFQTDRNAPNERIVQIDLKHPEEKNWITLIPQHPKHILLEAICVNNDKILIDYTHDVKHILQVHSLSKGEFIGRFSIGLEDIYDIRGGKNHSEFFIQLKSYVTPGTIYRYDFDEPNANLTLFREEKLNLNGFNRDNFEEKQVFYSSRDGTKIPMFIVQKKSSNSGPKPTLLYGYGGFYNGEFPTFDVAWLFFIDSFDGILAVANIRGGDEYGDRWHDAGSLFNKQNSYDDFQAAAEYLIKQKYTEAKKIAIEGESNGGLMIGVCINQRPDLFGAAVARFGAMDMLRYHKFTIGAAWLSEFGSSNVKKHFENRKKFSPLHNVHTPNSTENQYPATLLITSQHNYRVSPLHSLKFAATLQYAVQANKFQKNPILLRVYGGEKTKSKLIDEETDILTFLYRTLRIESKI